MVWFNSISHNFLIYSLYTENFFRGGFAFRFSIIITISGGYAVYVGGYIPTNMRMAWHRNIFGIQQMTEQHRIFFYILSVHHYDTMR